MHLPNSLRRSLPAVCLVPLSLVGACDVSGIPAPDSAPASGSEPPPSELELPIPLDTPPVELDVGGPVAEAVSSACTDPASPSCGGIAAICKADNDGAACDPVVLPPRFPKEVEDPLTGETVSADSLLPDEVVSAAEVRFALPVDLAALLENQGVSSADQVKQISFSKLELSWQDNGLTFDVPVLDVYVGPKVDDVSDPAALIARDGFDKVGTVGKDLNDDGQFDVGQEAATSGLVPVSFVAGGTDAFNEALRTLSFTIVLAAPDGQSLTLREVPGTDPIEVARPGGTARVKMTSELTFTVDLAGTLGAE
jgi:hypothetical protein